MRPLFLFDLDGTLYGGDAPFRYFAESIAHSMKEPGRTQYLAQCMTYFQDLAGAIEPNWDAVVKMTEPYIVDPNAWAPAYWKTRQYMLDDACPLTVDPALRRFLDQARDRATLVCATNSPPEAAHPLLHRLHLYDAFDQVYTDVGKPDGLLALVARLQKDQDPIPADSIVSIGDNYANDIAPAWQAGWTTAHISSEENFLGPSTIRGRCIQELIPFLTDHLIRHRSS